MTNQKQEDPQKKSALDLGDLTILEEPEIREEPPKETPLTDLIMSQCNPPREEIPAEKNTGSARKKWIFLGWILTAVLAAALCIGAVCHHRWNGLLGTIGRPEGKTETISQEEFAYWATYNPDGSGDQEAGGGTWEAPTLAPTMPSLEGDYITNILVIGQSFRAGEESKLADSILLCSLNRKSNTLTLTSFLRDTYIQMPNYQGHICGKNRINVVYNLGWHWGGQLGGMEMMDLCLKNNFGIEVDHNVEISFDTFSQIIDLLGGIDIELSEAEVDYLRTDKPEENGYVKPGENHLNGFTALCYARARKLDGDVQRTQRQRKVVSAILRKVKTMSTGQIRDLLSEILPLVTTDMTNEEITELVKDAIPMLKDLKLSAGTCPAEGTYWGEMIVIAGYPSGVLNFHLKPNQTLLQWICEVPAFEASPEGPPPLEIPAFRPRIQQPEKAAEPAPETTAPASPETVPPTQPETQPPAVPETQDPAVPESTGDAVSPETDPADAPTGETGNS